MSIDSEIVKIKLDKVLNKQGYFSICDIKKIGELLGTNVQARPHYKRLNALHCVNYADMSDELREELPSLIMSCLTARYDVDVMSKALLAVHTNEINSSTQIEDSEVKSKKILRFLR